MRCGSQVEDDVMLFLLTPFFCTSVLLFVSTCLMSVIVLLLLFVGACLFSPLLILPHSYFCIVMSNSLCQLGKWCSCLVYLISLVLGAASPFLLRTPHTFRWFLMISNWLGKMLCFSWVPSNPPLSLMDAFCHSECRPVFCSTSFASHRAFSFSLRMTLWWDLFVWWLDFWPVASFPSWRPLCSWWAFQFSGCGFQSTLQSAPPSLLLVLPLHWLWIALQ
jgi:hypothetical protein